jgi:putative thioredoxin
MGPGRSRFKPPTGLVFFSSARIFPLAENSEPPSMADSPHIVEIDENNYEQVVLQGSHQVPVLVDFWASWCQPCKMLMPLLAKLVDEYQGRFTLAKINTEEQQAIAAQFGIRSIPTVKLFRDGQPVDEFAGALPESEVRAFLDRHLPRASDGSIVRADERLQAGDTEGALGLLSQARVEDPHNPRLLTAIAQIQATEGDFEAADQTLSELPADEQAKPEVRQLSAQLFFGQIAAAANTPEATARRVAEAPDDTESRYRLAAQQVMAGEMENAMENLLLIVQKDRKFGDDAGRIALLKLFDVLGEDPAINRYRARMFNLLH